MVEGEAPSEQSVILNTVRHERSEESTFDAQYRTDR
jgi:hypothetical protein